MRIIFKIIAAPFVLVLTIVVSFLYFILSVGDWFFALAGGALAIMGVISWAYLHCVRTVGAGKHTAVSDRCVLCSMN